MHFETPATKLSYIPLENSTKKKTNIITMSNSNAMIDAKYVRYIMTSDGS